LLGFYFDVGIGPNNINEIACKFKSPATTNIMSLRFDLGSGRRFDSDSDGAEAPSRGSTSLQQFVEWLVFRVQCGSLHRIDDDGDGIEG